MSWLVRSVLLLACSCAAVRLSTRLGEIQGKQLVTPRTGKEYFAFTAVPYAEPPVGHLRLKNPVFHKGWNGTLDATKPAPVCIQTVVFFSAMRDSVMGEEDCLNLNIYTPTTDAAKKLPVLVYIHGGGFRCGMPPATDEAATNFMEEDVVLVNVFYRLGTLGFLSTEDAEIPGNFGLKDQAMALKWLSQNIDQFGGDPDLITVFGESAGGASVHYLITSPLSRDLVKGAAAESGVTDGYWALAKPGSARKTAETLAKLVGCEINNNFLQCLQQKDAEKLIKAETDFLFWDYDPVVVFQPVIEVATEGAFMTENPRNVEVTKPLITGVVPGEGILKTASLFNQDESLLDEFMNNADVMLPKILLLNPDTPNLHHFVEVLIAKYFKDLSNRQDAFQGLEDLYRDILFVYPMYKTLERHKGPKYGYLFNHRAPYSFSMRFGPKNIPHEVACHGDEVLSLFNVTSTYPGLKGREEDRLVSRRLVKLWTNFGKYQNPTPTGSPVIWEEYQHGNVLHITTEEDKMDQLPYDEVVEFWDEAMRIIESPTKDEL